MSGLTQGPAAAASVTGRALADLAPTLYVSNGRGGTVTPIATATNTPGPPIEVGTGPGLIVITPDGKTAYVTGNGDRVTPIATATNTPGPPIEVGHHAGRQDCLRHQFLFAHGDADRDRDQHAGTADHGRHGTTGDRDHAGREDRLRRQLAGGCRDADRDRDEHAGTADRGRRGGTGVRDHGGWQDPLRPGLGGAGLGGADRDRDQHAGHADRGRRWTICDRDHALTQIGADSLPVAPGWRHDASHPGALALVTTADLHLRRDRARALSRPLPRTRLLPNLVTDGFCHARLCVYMGEDTHISTGILAVGNPASPNPHCQLGNLCHPGFYMV